MEEGYFDFLVLLLIICVLLIPMDADENKD